MTGTDQISIASIDDQVASVERELKLRETMYPRWVANGKMKSSRAAYELAAMRGVLETLKRVQANSDTHRRQATQAQLLDLMP